jgi:hypothetical protein
MGLQRGRTLGDGDDDKPDEVSVAMSDGRRLVIRGLEAPANHDDLVEEQELAQVPKAEPDQNREAAWKHGLAL